MPQDDQFRGTAGERLRDADRSAPPSTQASLAPRPAFAALKAPSLTLPSGGGAIRGIGEVFRTNPANGTAGFDIPLPTTSAPHGPTPQLSLSYDAGQGNGPFGAGWSVAIPQIARSTDKRLPEYRDAENSDLFVLSGAEHLVPGQRVETSAEVVERFRPRIEGLFARIERVTEKALGEVYWRSTSRDNVTSYFGTSAASRIADPANPNHVFAWLLARTEDDRGHVVEYTYKAEDLSGVDATKPSESHRLSGLSPIVNRYPKSIRYGNTAPSDASTCMFELIFDYGEHAEQAPSPQESADWPCRLDAFSSYRAGFEIRTYRLCRRVLMFHHFASLGGFELVRSLDLGYSENSSMTKLTSAHVTGYAANQERTGYSLKSTPSISLTYAEPVFDTRVRDLDDSEVGEELPRMALGARVQWTDLDGEGLPGLLADWDGAIRYHRNLGGILGPATTLASAPGLSALASGGSQLMNVAGTGTLAMLTRPGPGAGFHERTSNGWGPFVPFKEQPVVDWNDANLRLVDLNGDGLDDLLITRGDYLEWHPSLGRDGFGPARTVPLPRDEEKGARVIFADGTASVMLADMSGDGLADLVRITYSGVSYWPNLGQGRFGPQVSMDRPPFLEPQSQFDARRIRMADVDGSGTADLLYFTEDGMSVFMNQGGNGFAPGLMHPGITADALRTLSIIDLFGVGTACVVWAPVDSGGAPPPLRVADLLASTKPHLLVELDNAMGGQVRLHHAPSTKFYLGDQRAGRPWITKLPFPVQVIDRVETYDAVSRTRLVTTYAYHHGHYDADEHEFRGFGMVEQWDTESFAAERGAGLFPDQPSPLNDEIRQPPVLTKTWFHTGAWREQAAVGLQYAKEYWPGDPSAPKTMECVLPDGIAPEELREAARALKGASLRTEVYGLDGSNLEPYPFSVTEANYEVRRLQPRDRNLYGVFHTVPREQRQLAYDRNPSDPRIAQSLALEVDAYGTVVKGASFAYPRRVVPADLPEQGRLRGAVTEAQVLHLDAAANGYRLGIPIQTRLFELTGIAPDPGGLIMMDAARAAYATASTIAYHETPGSGFVRREIARTAASYYDTAHYPNVFANGQADPLALSYQSYRLDLSDELLAATFDTRVTPAILTEGGYISLPGESGYWTPSGHAEHDPVRFFLPTRFIDPFGAATTITYENNMLVASVDDAAGNQVSATNDYRVMAPSVVVDANGNRNSAAFDELGMVVRTAVASADGSQGDTLDKPTTRFEYDLDRYASSGKANFVHTFARETHGADDTHWHESYVFSDGSGRVVMTKAQAAAAPWVGTGRTVLNNKGNPVKQYEPFFSQTWEMETEAELVQQGVTAIMTYDAIGRLVRTDLPNGSYRRWERTPWQETTFDENDTATEPGNIWWAHADQRAQARTAPHGNTPTITHCDVLGRAMLVIADNGLEGRYATRTNLDIEGQVLEVIDPLGRACERAVYAIGGAKLRVDNIDSGTRWAMSDVLGNPLRRWDERDQVFRFQYDALRRPTHHWVQTGSTAEILVLRNVWGESHSSATALNLRGRIFAVYDGAGSVQSGYDFKGNVTAQTRRLARIYQAQADWSSLATISDALAVLAAAEPLLEAELFTQTTAFDALNRPTLQTTPDASQMRPTYNAAGLLDRVDVNLHGSGVWTPFVAGIDYNAKSQREQIRYGNQTSTSYQYDPLTFRLVRLTTARATDSAALQDLSYAFDPVGNILAITDQAQQTVLFANAVVEPSTDYVYDAVYRLSSATGREHAGGVADTQRDQDDVPLDSLPHQNDGQALRRYQQNYLYDAVGNFIQFIHIAQGNTAAGWTRRYTYEPGSNRLQSTSLPGDPDQGPYSAKYPHDAHGSIVKMMHLASIDYDYRDKMVRADLGGGGTAYYTYDAGGIRVRKVIDSGMNLIKERVYLGGYEIYREKDISQAVSLERQTLHVADGTKTIALVETKTIDSSVTNLAPTPRSRFQLGNHLQSALLECNEHGLVFSYEEYHPYGTSAYRAGASGVDVSDKRYRYCNAERDDETGFYCMGQRYYCPWLARWTSSDPLGLGGGANLYGYVRANPINLTDLSGTQPAGIPGQDYEYDPNSGQTVLRVSSSWEDYRAQCSVDLHTGKKTSPSISSSLEVEAQQSSVVLHNLGVVEADKPLPAFVPAPSPPKPEKLEDKSSLLSTLVKSAIQSVAPGAFLLPSPQDIADVTGLPIEQVDPGPLLMMTPEGAPEVASMVIDELAAGLRAPFLTTGTAVADTSSTIGAASPRLLMVGPENQAEFSWLTSQGEAGWQTTAVNPFRTDAATSFEASGGRFVQSGVENIGETFDWTHESFPQPLGRTLDALENYQARLNTLAPGGRLTILTENEELIDMYRNMSATPRSSFTFTVSQFTAAHPDVGSLPPAVSGFVGSGSDIWLITITH